VSALPPIADVAPAKREGQLWAASTLWTTLPVCSSGDGQTPLCSVCIADPVESVQRNLAFAHRIPSSTPSVSAAWISVFSAISPPSGPKTNEVLVTGQPSLVGLVGFGRDNAVTIHSLPGDRSAHPGGRASGVVCGGPVNVTDPGRCNEGPQRCVAMNASPVHFVSFKLISSQLNAIAHHGHITLARGAEEPAILRLAPGSQTDLRKKAPHIEPVEDIGAALIDRCQTPVLPVGDGRVTDAKQLTQLLTRVVPVAAGLARIVSTWPVPAGRSFRDAKRKRKARNLVHPAPDRGRVDPELACDLLHGHHRTELRNSRM